MDDYNKRFFYVFLPTILVGCFFFYMNNIGETGFQEKLDSLSNKVLEEYTCNQIEAMIEHKTLPAKVHTWIEEYSLDKRTNTQHNLLNEIEQKWFDKCVISDVDLKQDETGWRVYTNPEPEHQPRNTSDLFVPELPVKGVNFRIGK